MITTSCSHDWGRIKKRMIKSKKYDIRWRNLVDCLVFFTVENCIPLLDLYVFRKYNYKLPDDNVVQFLYGINKVHLNNCLRLDFGSEHKFSFSQLSLTLSDLTREKMKTKIADTLSCFVVTIGKKQIQVQSKLLKGLLTYFLH